jgi:O-succinylbenzoic acid--CoA ligase
VDEWLSSHDGSRAAIVADGHTLSYTELRRRADHAARRLAGRGVGAGDRVAVLLPPGIEFAALAHALPRLGAVLVPVNTRLTAAERDWVIADSGASLVVDRPLGGREADVDLRTTIDPDDPHCVVYTSGTTSRPKPVVLTYGNHLASAQASAANLGVHDDDAWLGVLPLFHVGGLQVLLRSAIYGTTAVIEPGFDPQRVRALLEGGAVTLASFVPTMITRLREAGWSGTAPRLRAALIGGGPVPGELLDWAADHGVPLLPTYGMTETASQIVTAAGPGAHARPLPGVELSTTSEGELVVLGPMVSAGALSDDGWLHTGDRGHVDAGGNVHVEGRIGDTIITGGENVAAAEVEDALLSHPGVRDAGVVGRPDDEWGQVVVAYVVADGVSDDELLGHARRRLAGYKLPKAIHRLDELPRNAAGKLVRGRLK